MDTGQFLEQSKTIYRNIGVDSGENLMDTGQFLEQSKTIYRNIGVDNGENLMDTGQYLEQSNKYTERKSDGHRLVPKTNKKI